MKMTWSLVIKGKLFPTQALSQAQENVSEPQSRRESNPQPSDLRWDALTIELPVS